MEPRRIIIVGGGITGLTAAYYVKKDMEHLGLPYDIKVIEAKKRVGGKIHTLYKEGFVLERGADSFLERKKPAIKLVEALGLTDELVRNSTGQAYILLGNTLHKMPAGSYMGIPLNGDVLRESNLISEMGKLRVMEDITLPKGDPATDQSLGHFLRSRFGDELIENLIEPLLSGIYSSDMDKMSLMASFPQFYELEQKYGSLIQGLKETLPTKQASTGKRKGQFLTFRFGLETLINALVEAIGEGNIMLGSPVNQVINGKEAAYEISLQNGGEYAADSVIMATPHSVIPELFDGSQVFEPLKMIPMASVANVVLAFDRVVVQSNLEGTGFVVSRNSDFRMTACTWTHRKWPQTTPNGKVLLRVYVGKPSDQEIVNKSDKEIVAIVLHELHKVMNISAEPEFTIVNRWQNQMPQYRIGHMKTWNNIQNGLEKEFPGMYLAGSSYEGVGIPDCIEQGEKAAIHVMQFLQSKM